MRELIRCGRPLAEIAHETAFYDQAHFTRTFSRAYGMTPAAYRAGGDAGKLTLGR